MIEWIPLMQVIVTLAIIPMMTAIRFERHAKNYVESCDASLLNELSPLIQSSKTKYLTLVSTLFLIGLAMAIHAMFYQVELLAWDNQAGIIVLSFIAMVPILFISHQQQQFLNALKSKLGSLRSASLTPKGLSDYIAMPSIVIILLAHVFYLYTLLHFLSHPFEGFAGWTNLIGLVFLDVVFVAGLWVSYTNKSLNGIQDPVQRYETRNRTIRIGVAAWIFALLYLSVSLWLSGLALDQMNLLVQSLYMQCVIVIAAFMFKLPESSFRKKAI